LAEEVGGDLSGVGDVLLAGGAGEVVGGEPVVGGGAVDDVERVVVAGAGGLGLEVADRLLREGEVDVAAAP